MAKDTSLTVRIDEPTKAALIAAAAKVERSHSWYVERALRQALQRDGFLPNDKPTKTK